MLPLFAKTLDIISLDIKEYLQYNNKIVLNYSEDKDINVVQVVLYSPIPIFFNP